MPSSSIAASNAAIPPKAVQPKKKLARPSALTQAQISSQIKQADPAPALISKGATTEGPVNKMISAHQVSTHLQEESKMSSIHEIARTGPPNVDDSNKLKVLRSDDNSDSY